jgi:hypothetical protein
VVDDTHADHGDTGHRHDQRGIAIHREAHYNKTQARIDTRTMRQNWQYS